MREFKMVSLIIRLVCHPMHVPHTLMCCLLLLLVHLLPSTAARRVAPSSAAVGLGMHDDGSPVHDAHNSWSDTGRVLGPTGTKRVKGGVSGPAEDLRPVSEVEAGVKFRPAGGVRGQVAGSLPGRQPGTGTRPSKGRCGRTFPPPGGSWYPFRVTWIRIGHQAINGLDEGGCGTARSGIWVLKGNARARMFPANFDHAVSVSRME